MSNPQHMFTRVGGTRFVATMMCGAASVLLLANGHLSGAEFVELGKWTLGVFIAGNATQNAASYFGSNSKPTDNNGSDTNANRQY